MTNDRSNCKICNNPKSAFILNNKSVCFRCDDLMFDIEIECDDDKNVVPLITVPTTVPTKDEKNDLVPKK